MKKGERVFSKIEFLTSQDEMSNLERNQRYLLLVAEKSSFDYTLLPKNIAIVGAIFPRIIYGTKSYDKGYILATMSANTSAFVHEEMQAELAIADLNKLNSFMVFVDGFSSNISHFLESFFGEVNGNAKIIGAGAGKLTLKQEPVVFSNKAIYQNAALIIGSYNYMGIGVKHGWEEIEGPFIATKTDNCILEKINFQDAFEVYKEVVEQDSEKIFTDKNFFDIAKAYPFGITRHSREVVVRDPIMTDGKKITLVGEMDENAIISILRGNKENLIEAASEAAYDSVSDLKMSLPKHSVVIDCISRFLFLAKEFDAELLSIKAAFYKGSFMWGVLSLGEIANANQENIEFYNKTCVVGAL